MVDNSEEAARWFAASRRGVMLHDERAAFEAWRRNPANAARLHELQAIWLSLESVAIAPGVEPVVADHSASIGHGRQLIAMAGFVALTVLALPRIDGVWWNALDWWSR